MNRRALYRAYHGEVATTPQPRQWHDNGAAHIDVRGLAPPQPLVAILRLLASVGEGASVVAHLDRDPVMLYPELAQIGWRAEAIPGDPGETRLRLWREG